MPGWATCARKDFVIFQYYNDTIIFIWKTKNVHQIENMFSFKMKYELCNNKY